MKKISLLLFGLISLVNTDLTGQCDAEDICAEEVLMDSIMDPGPVTIDCFDHDNTAFYSFTTNNSTNNFGGIEITLSSVDCPDALTNDSLTVVVIELINPNGNPCDPINWAGSLGCQGGNGDMSVLLSDGSLSNTTGYTIIVGNDQPAAAQDCFYDIEIEGMWVDIDACCDADIVLGDLVDLTVEGSDNGYHWTGGNQATILNPNSDNPTIGAQLTTTFVVTGEVDDCIVTDVITIFVGPPIEVMNTFTPNGDGINDTFVISGINRFENAQVTIFDRWGQQLFKSIGYTRVWDGTNKGKKLPPATYYYVIEFNSIDVEIEPYTGWVAIVY